MAIETLFDADEISARCREIGAQISDFYRDKPLTLVILANGGIFFGVDLSRQVDTPCWVDVIAVSSYTEDAKCSEPVFRCAPKLPVAGRHILLVDDVLDSGETIACCTGYFKKLGALSVASAVLAEKPYPGRTVKADWKCFDAPDSYLIGSGMDSCEFYRNLNAVAVMSVQAQD